MRTKQRYFSFLCWPAAAAVVLHSASALAQPVPTPTPTATATSASQQPADFKSEFNFGTIAEGDHVVHEFSIRNSGRTDLVLQRVAPSCGCTATTLSASTISPGGVGVVKVDFNTAGFSGQKTKTVSVITSDPQQPELVFVLTGVVVPAVVVEPEWLHFGEIVPSSTTEQRKKTFTVRPGQGISEPLKVSSPSKYLKLTPEGRDGQSERYSVEVLSDAPSGSLRERVVVEVGSGRPAVNLPVFATIRSDLRVVPQSISFGVFSGPALVERQVQIQSVAESPVSITLVPPEEPGVSATLSELKPGRSWEVRIAVDPARLRGEDLKSVVEVQTSHPDHPKLSINIFGTRPPRM